MPIAPSPRSDLFDSPAGSAAALRSHLHAVPVGQPPDACDSAAPVAGGGQLGVAEALSQLLRDRVPAARFERLSAESAIGRITAEAVISRTALPRFDNSAMDGYAVHAADIASLPGHGLKLAGGLKAGGTVDLPLIPGTAVRVTTGAPVPPGAAAVIPDEWVELDGAGTVFPLRSVRSSANIRRRGEDLAEGEILLRRGARLTAGHAAVLAAAGVTGISASRRVVVAVMSIGDELLSNAVDAGPGKIVDVNRLLVSRVLALAGAEIIDCGIVPDSIDAIVNRLAMARAADLLVTTGGAANSESDLTAGAIEAAGGSCRKLEIALKPGKSIAFGTLRRLATLHLPGNPIAALVTAHLFARPLVEKLSGGAAEDRSIQVRLGEPITHRMGRSEFLLARLTAEPTGGTKAFRCGSGGSAALRPLLEAEGLLELSADSGDAQRGHFARFHPLPGILR